MYTENVVSAHKQTAMYRTQNSQCSDAVLDQSPQQLVGLVDFLYFIPHWPTPPATQAPPSRQTPCRLPSWP